MTASPLHAADSPCRPKRDHYAGRGAERSRTAAHSLILRNPADVVRTTPRIAVYRISAGWRAGDSYCRLSLKGVTARNLETNLPALHFQSVGAPTDARGLRGFILPAFRLGLKFFPVLTASGSRLSLGLLRFKPLQKSERVIANPTHFDPFCRFAGLVARFERHEVSERKIPNGDKPGARPGNLTARARNAY